MSVKFTVAVLAATVAVAGCSNSKDGAGDLNKSSGSSGASAAATNSGVGPGAPAGGQDWKTTASGLKYQVMKHGSGAASPKATDTVKVHYHGTLLDGTVFDSSVQRGEPISFPLNRVIPGWTEGVQLMKVGDKFKFEIPPHLAYGPSSPSPKIPPNSTLVFEVELLAIE
jgi:FKBP-type peptidyl-prolyl cis-trans isomerase